MYKYGGCPEAINLKGCPQPTTRKAENVEAIVQYTVLRLFMRRTTSVTEIVHVKVGQAQGPEMIQNVPQQLEASLSVGTRFAYETQYYVPATAE